jgi:DNA-binding NarL/FixJ family response regulator
MGEEAAAVCDAYGEGWHKAYAMMALGIEVWREDDTRRATVMEQESLRFNHSLDDPLGVGMNLEALAWIATTEEQYPRVAQLLGIAQTAWQTIGAPLSGYAHLGRYHDECEFRARQALGPAAFQAAFNRGAELPFDEAVAYALKEPVKEQVPAGAWAGAGGRSSPLTRRETEIVQLIAQGMSNKEIAAALVIAQRTAEGHVEHILNKLGFNSRAQIATWVGEQNRADEEDHPSG